jgi:hypothetical protein
MTAATTRDPRDVRLTANEQKAMSAWIGEDCGWGLYFETVAKRSGLPRHLVRRTVRALARKGMVELERLFDDDGHTAGSGYGVTPKGRAWSKTATIIRRGDAE